MHEAALTRNIVDIACDAALRNGAAHVRVVRLRVGDFAPAEPEALRFCFEAAARGTIAEGARLDIRRAPGRGRCLDCGAAAALAARFDPCPACGGSMIVTSGEEFTVEELEAE